MRFLFFLLLSSLLLIILCLQIKAETPVRSSSMKEDNNNIDDDDNNNNDSPFSTSSLLRYERLQLSNQDDDNHYCPPAVIFVANGVNDDNNVIIDKVNEADNKKVSSRQQQQQQKYKEELGEKDINNVPIVILHGSLSNNNNNIDNSINNEALINCRSSNPHQLPCNTSWPVIVKCWIVSAVNARTPAYTPSLSTQQQQQQHIPNTGELHNKQRTTLLSKLLKWDCRVDIEHINEHHRTIYANTSGTTPPTLFGEDVTVHCGANKKNINKIKTLPLDSDHVRTKRPDLSWSEFQQKVFEAERVLAEASQHEHHDDGDHEDDYNDSTNHLLVVREEMTTKKNMNKQPNNNIKKYCYRWLPRKSEAQQPLFCTVTFSLRNHDRQLVLLSLAMLLVVLFVSICALLCRPASHSKKSKERAVNQVLDDLEQAALAKAFTSQKMKESEDRMREINNNNNNSNNTRVRIRDNNNTTTRITTDSYPIDEIVM